MTIMEQALLTDLVAQRPSLASSLLEMSAFEQAVSAKEPYYHYPLSQEDSVEARRLRLMTKLSDGRVRLSNRGRRLAEVL
jgi:hypothetical protein